MNISEISKLFKQHNLKIKSYKKKDNAYIVDTNSGKYVVKVNINKEYIFNYLDSRGFNYYPKILINDKYQVTEYLSSINIPKEQKINDLIDLVGILHSKTTYNKRKIIDEYENIYADLNNNYNYLLNYYNEIIDQIDNSIFLSPSNYLICRNISLIFDSLNMGMNYLEEFKNKIKDLDNIRVCVVHNDLSLDNYVKNNKQYLLNWDKSKIDIPIFDLYKLYNNENDIDFNGVIKRYEKKYPLKPIEKDLLIILLLMPDKIEFNGTELNMCKVIRKSLNKLSKIQEMIYKIKSQSKDD